MAYQPQFPYEGRQIIIDSGRVTLNSKDDTTFLLGREAVSISSGGTINIDSNGDFLLNSSKIYSVDSNGADLAQVQSAGSTLLIAADQLSKAIKTMNSNKSFTL